MFKHTTTNSSGNPIVNPIPEILDLLVSIEGMPPPGDPGSGPLETVKLEMFRSEIMSMVPEKIRDSADVEEKADVLFPLVGPHALHAYTSFERVVRVNHDLFALKVIPANTPAVMVTMMAASMMQSFLLAKRDTKLPDEITFTPAFLSPKLDTPGFYLPEKCVWYKALALTTWALNGFLYAYFMAGPPDLTSAPEVSENQFLAWAGLVASAAVDCDGAR